MGIKSENRKNVFEELYFEKGCDIIDIINKFFMKYEEYIKGDKEYITYKIRKLIEEDRKYLKKINGEGQDVLNRIGKISYIRHDVIPEENEGREYYIYCINTFI
jgi:hypothetical protein